VKLAKNIGFDEVNVHNVKESLNSHKMKLCTDDVVQLKKAHQEEEE
jgi:hypothetical protein